MALPYKKSGTLCFFLILLSFSLRLVTTSAGLQRFEHPTKEDGSINFLVLGDWGRKGDFNQSKVAYQMGKIGEKLDIDFVVSTGDNFYDNGLSSENDTAFAESFTEIYTQNSLQKQWYNILGNHDYRGDVEAQLSPLLRKIDSRWLCLQVFPSQCSRTSRDIVRGHHSFCGYVLHKRTQKPSLLMIGEE